MSYIRRKALSGSGFGRFRSSLGNLAMSLMPATNITAMRPAPVTATSIALTPAAPVNAASITTSVAQPKVVAPLRLPPNTVPIAPILVQGKPAVVPVVNRVPITPVMPVTLTPPTFSPTPTAPVAPKDCVGCKQSATVVSPPSNRMLVTPGPGATVKDPTYTDLPEIVADSSRKFPWWILAVAAGGVVIYVSRKKRK